MGIVPLLALLENSLLKPSLFHLLIQHLCQLFIKVDNLCLQAVDHGLLETLCNVVYGLCTLHDRQRCGIIKSNILKPLYNVLILCS